MVYFLKRNLQYLIIDNNNNILDKKIKVLYKGIKIEIIIQSI